MLVWGVSCLQLEWLLYFNSGLTLGSLLSICVSDTTKFLSSWILCCLLYIGFQIHIILWSSICYFVPVFEVLLWAPLNLVYKSSAVNYSWFHLLCVLHLEVSVGWTSFSLDRKQETSGKSLPEKQQGLYTPRLAQVRVDPHSHQNPDIRNRRLA